MSAINKDQYLNVAKQLYETEEFKDAFLINIMRSFVSRSSEIQTLRFKDINDGGGQKSIYYFANKRNQRKYFTISNGLYDKVIHFKEF